MTRDLSEEDAGPRSVARHVHRLLDRREPAVLCTHRPVLPHVSGRPRRRPTPASSRARCWWSTTATGPCTPWRSTRPEARAIPGHPGPPRITRALPWSPGPSPDYQGMSGFYGCPRWTHHGEQQVPVGSGAVSGVRRATGRAAGRWRRTAHGERDPPTVGPPWSATETRHPLVNEGGPSAGARGRGAGGGPGSRPTSHPGRTTTERKGSVHLPFTVHPRVASPALPSFGRVLGPRALSQRSPGEPK